MSPKLKSNNHRRSTDFSLSSVLHGIKGGECTFVLLTLPSKIIINTFPGTLLYILRIIVPRIVIK
jgi:hypothetical protein